MRVMMAGGGRASPGRDALPSHAAVSSAEMPGEPLPAGAEGQPHDRTNLTPKHLNPEP